MVIVTQGGASVYPVRAAGAAMPVVFGVSSDPVEAGFGESFAHPGHNITGVTFLSLELVGKRMELLKEDGSAMRHSERIASFAVKNRIPAISGWAELPNAAIS